MNERNYSYAETLVASRTVTASGDTSASPVTIIDPRNAVQLVLDVTAGSTDGTDTLDVVVRTMIDGKNYEDVAHFNQVGGDFPVKRYIAKVVGRLGVTMGTNGALSAGSIRNIAGDKWIVAWTVVSGNAASFTFSVTAVPC